MNVFMIKESVSNSNACKAAEHCESLTIIFCYASRHMGAYCRFHALTRFLDLRVKVSHPEFDEMLRDLIYNIL